MIVNTQLAKFLPLVQDAVYRVLPQGSQELPSMPSLDDSVQVIGEASAAPGFQSIRALLPPAPSSPTNFAQRIQPAPLASMSSEYFSSLSRSRVLNFTIILNDARTTISVN